MKSVRCMCNGNALTAQGAMLQQQELVALVTT
jgi:hypothetical protein